MDIVKMPIEKSRTQLFSEKIRQVDSSINSFEVKKVTLDPFANDLKLNIHVTRPGSGFLCHGHCRASIVIFVEYGSSMLGYPEIPKDAANIE